MSNISIYHQMQFTNLHRYGCQFETRMNTIDSNEIIKSVNTGDWICVICTLLLYTGSSYLFTPSTTKQQQAILETNWWIVCSDLNIYWYELLGSVLFCLDRSASFVFAPSLAVHTTFIHWCFEQFLMRFCELSGFDCVEFSWCERDSINCYSLLPRERMSEWEKAMLSIPSRNGINSIEHRRKSTILTWSKVEWSTCW